MVRQMQAFYEGIAGYEIQTYDYDNGQRYKIMFLPFKVLSNFLKGLTDEDLTAFFKKFTTNQNTNEFSFIQEKMTFNQVWEAIPKEYKLEDSKQYYEDTFRPVPRKYYKREVLVENLKKMLEEGKLNRIS